MAVSKTKPVELIRRAYDAGQRVFGENRVQELTAKAPVLPADCEWHLIGPLQRNKVRAAVRHAAYIHSVDSRQLIARIDRIAAEENVQPRILLQINALGEETKSGVDAKAARELLPDALSAPHISCRGLMTMAPFGVGDDQLRHVFGGLRQLRDELQDEFGVALPDLSMGMSGDFPVAVAEGATMVRVGTAIFGSRLH